jgi:3-hydroxyisobutyrate dehydrogenase-like beta-hydroxyacid dehydrogenase
MMVKGRYDDATMKIAIWQKDMQVIGDFAKKIGAPCRCLQPPAVYQAALAGGHAMHDTAAVCAVLERRRACAGENPGLAEA